MADEAVALPAPPLSAGVTTLVLDAEQMQLQVHESVGHPTELDRIYGTEAAYAGTSSWEPDDLGSLRYGSELMNVTADATTPGGLGTFGFDDEACPRAASRSSRPASSAASSPHARPPPAVGPVAAARCGPTAGAGCRSSA